MSGDRTRLLMGSSPGLLAAGWRNAALEDCIALVFHSYLLARMAFAAPSPERTLAMSVSCVLLAVTCTAVGLTRFEVFPRGWLRTLVYRVGIFAPLPLSYVQMKSLLPALQPELLDMQLWAMDEALLGVTPAVWLARFNTPPVVEWVSFFYYSYFGLMIAMLVPTLLFDEGRRLRECMLGALVVGACGDATYTLVPGAGPVATIAFAEPLHGGFFWQQVLLAVQAGGAQLDIFPSLHTAFPTFYALHAFGWRRTRAFRFTWPVVAFFAANMVFATMFLRWHWFVDVLAGLGLAFFARGLAIWVSGREPRLRAGRPPAWEPIR